MPIHPGAIWALFKELRVAADEEEALVVEGPPALADALRRELADGARPGSVRGGPPEGAQAMVLVLAAAVGPEDEERLKHAHREGVPTIAVLAGPGLDPRVPYVLATDVIEVPAGSGFPVVEIAAAVAARLGESGTGLAARVPVVRRAVCEQLIETFSRRNAAVGAAVFVPGADFPVITLGQLRLVLRLAAAHGVEIDRQRLPEVLAVIAGGLGLRGLARQALRSVPVAGFLVRGTVAYAGTRAVGEAAMRYFAAQAQRAA